MRYLLAIDSGSQSTKVSVVDEHGRIHASAQNRLPPSETGPNGRVVHPGDDLWDSITLTCREALSRFAGDLGEIAGVGLCTIRFCRVLLRADGSLAEPVLSWMDARVSRPHEPRDDVRWLTTSSGYITLRLTGNRIDSAGNQQGVWPIDQHTARWSDDPQAYRETGMPREMLFDLVDPGDPLGTVTREASVATGVPHGLPVYATANDKAVEALGCGLRKENEVLLSLGTYIAAMTPGQQSLSDDERFWTNFASTPQAYLHESLGIRRGMWTVSWFRRLTAETPEDTLNHEAALVEPGSGGLMAILDWLAPGDAPHRRGALLGFDGSQDRAHVYRALLEGIALTMADHIEALQAGLGRRFSHVIVSGGGSRSDLMMQIVADVLALPTRRAALPDAAGMGAAICAAVGGGVHASFDSAIEAMVTVTDEFTPAPDQVKVYDRVRLVHNGVRDRADDLFRWVAAVP